VKKEMTTHYYCENKPEMASGAQKVYVPPFEHLHFQGSISGEGRWRFKQE
jgi:hypothetical protein